MGIDEKYIKELLQINNDYLFHRENQIVEYKEQFNFNGLADYFKDFAAFANNKGGHVIYGIKDSPRIPVGLNKQSIDQLNKLDTGKISGYLLEIFSSDIVWEQMIIEHENKLFGVFKIYECLSKPIIAKKDEGRDQIIKSGEIYYRYGGRTQKIMYSELENIINKRIEQNNKNWIDLVTKIGKTGPQNAAILDTENGTIEKNENRVLLIDESLIGKLKFIKEGQFVEKEGSLALKLIGDVVPVDKIEVVKKIRESILKEYPITALELVAAIKKVEPEIRQSKIWKVIKDNDIKNNSDYSVYNFRSKKHEDNYKSSGLIPSSTPSIYKIAAIDFIIKILKQESDRK